MKTEQDTTCSFCNDTGIMKRYGIEEPCRCGINNQQSGNIIKSLTVTTDEERIQWIQLLGAASDYHFDMSKQFEPEIIGDKEMEQVADVHRAWGRAIHEATELISFWEIEENSEVLTPPDTKNITKEIENAD